MKHWVYISLLLFSAIFLVSCKDELENLTVTDSVPEITLKFTDAQISRTSLNSSEPLQHVKAVELYIYKLLETTEPATAFETRIQNATFLYATEALPWKSQSTSSGVSMSYKIQKPLQENGEYVFLAVGMDAESEENYTFPSFKEKFSEAVAALKEGKNITDMAVSEFFSGYQVAKYMRADATDANEPLALYPLVETDGSYEWDTANGTQIELNRAVSGVLLYLTDIPARLSKEGKNYRVTKFELVMHQSPATEVSLHDTEISSTPNSGLGTTLITSMDLSELNYDPATDGDLYKIEGQKGEVETLPNTLLYGAYVLPTAKSTTADTPTFSIQLYGKGMDENGNISSGENFEIPLESFPAMLEGDGKSSFDIVRNHIYCIGQKPVADDTEGDAPVSLAGKKITVKAVSWTEIEGDIEFPNLDVNASFVTDFDPGYRFNCINNEFTIQIKCLSTNRWKLIIPEGCNWLYVNNNGYWQSSYEQPALEEGSENGNTLSLFMKDFAEKRSYTGVDDINNDVRSVKLELQTLDSKGNIVGNPKYLTIEQYNAIYLEIKEKKWTGDVYYCRGFSRLDVGDSFKKKNPGDGSEWIGVAESTGAGYGWGYWDTPPTSVLPSNGDNYDGKKNMFDLMHTGYWAKGIAMHEAYYMCIEIENGIMMPTDIISENGLKRLPNENENFWYLPAMYEMQNFIYFYQYSDFIGKVTMSKWYWTMDPTGYYDWAYTARAQRLDSDGYHDDKMNRHNEYFSRPCINLGDYEK